MGEVLGYRLVLDGGGKSGRKSKQDKGLRSPRLLLDGTGKSGCNSLWRNELQRDRLLLDGVPLCGLFVAFTAGLALTFTQLRISGTTLALGIRVRGTPGPMGRFTALEVARMPFLPGLLVALLTGGLAVLLGAGVLP